MKFSRLKAEVDYSGIVKKEAVLDLADDARLARRWKRKRIGFENTRLASCSKKASKETRNMNDKGNRALVEVVTVDSDYGTYYNNMAQFVDLDTDDLCTDNVRNEENDDNATEVFDPDYMMFLNNLKEDGKSYVLEIALNNEVLMVLKYEEENGSNNGLYVENLENRKKENRKTENVSRSQIRREKIESPRNIMTKCKRGKTESSPKVLRSNSRWRQTESAMKSLRSSSRENSKRLTKTERPRTLWSDIRRDNKSPGILHEVLKREKAENPACLRNVSRRESMGPGRKSRDIRKIDEKSHMVEKKMLIEAKDHVSCAANGCSSKRESLKGARKDSSGIKSVSADESYLQFLELLDKRDGQLLLGAPEGGEMVLDENEESASSEVIILDNNLLLLGNSCPFVSSKLLGTCIDLDGEACTRSAYGSKESPFRKTLMETLQNPFDYVEYKKLWKEASYRKPPTRKKELRGRTVEFTICSDESDGKSYIDMYEGLAKRIDAAQHDPHKILNLLRGFFYWLKNKPQEDAFPPWEDPDCLRTLPPYQLGDLASDRDCNIP